MLSFIVGGILFLECISNKTLQFPQAQVPIFSRFEDSVIVTRFLHPQNANSSMNVTLSGMIIELSFSQDEYLLLVDYQYYTL